MSESMGARVVIDDVEWAVWADAPTAGRYWLCRVAEGKAVYVQARRNKSAKVGELGAWMVCDE